MSFVAVAGSAVALGSAAFKIGHGIHQRNLARKAANANVRPEMRRTGASVEQEQQARQMAGSTRLPGQSYAENQIGAQTARANNAIQQAGGSSGEVIAGLSNVDQNARNATNDLSFQAAQLNQHNKELFSGVLNNVNQDQQNIFDYNKNQPYQTKFLQNQQNMQSGNANINNGIDTLADGVNNFGVAQGYRRAKKIGDAGFDGSDFGAGIGPQ